MPQVAVRITALPRSQPTETGYGVVPQVTVARFAGRPRREYELSVLRDEQEYEAIDDPQDLAIEILFGEI
ncbi:MAG TPA: hypothetical protein VIK11_13835, partial [Tepidiformaceae bacterium]